MEEESAPDELPADDDSATLKTDAELGSVTMVEPVIDVLASEDDCSRLTVEK